MLIFRTESTKEYTIIHSILEDSSAFLLKKMSFGGHQRFEYERRSHGDEDKFAVSSKPKTDE